MALTDFLDPAWGTPGFVSPPGFFDRWFDPYYIDDRHTWYNFFLKP